MRGPAFVTYLQGKDNEDNYQTNQPERLQSLYSVLDAVEICPAAFEIYERLKWEYGFRK